MTTTGRPVRATYLAHRAMEYIRTHPDEHDQADWTKCFAGHVCRANGDHVDTEGNVVTENGVTMFVDQRARELLGLKPGSGPRDESFETMMLFYVFDVEELTQNVADILGPDAVYGPDVQP